MKFWLAPIIAVNAVAFLGCGPAPVYNADLGIDAIPVKEGELAGTFAMKTESSLIVDAPVIGEQESGGIIFHLIERIWDAEAEVYRQTNLLCGGESFETGGVTTTVPEATYRLIPPSEQDAVLDHRAGSLVVDNILELWGLGNLEDPLETPLPKSAEEADTPPHPNHIVDMDSDDKPGVTMFLTGLAIGDVYVIQRKTTLLEGITLGPDRTLGLANMEKETLVLGSTNPLAQGQTNATRPHPDPKETWFEEVRIEPGSNCDAVLDARDDGSLSRLRPF
jgi:hypothetical protein